MGQLSWMVVHGATVFRLAVVVAALLGLLLAWILPRAIARRRASIARRRLGPLAGPEAMRDGAAVTLRGQIEAGDAQALVTEAARVSLRGEIQVVDARAPRAALEGARVRVRGVLHDEPVTDRRLEYRAMERRWTLVPEGAGALLLAFEGPPRVASIGWRALSRGAGAGALVFVALSTLLGEIGASATFRPGPPSRATLASLLTLASPLHRERALSLLAQALSQRCLDEHKREHLEAQLSVAALREDCEGEAVLLIRHGQLERGARRAEGCGALRTAAQAQYFRGRFDLASLDLERAGPAAVRPENALADARFATVVHLLAGRPLPAADQARRASVEAWVTDAPARPQRRAGRRASVYACLAEELDRRAAAGSAPRPPPAEVTVDRAWLGCRILRAEADPAVRTPAFLAVAEVPEGYALPLLAESVILDERLDPPGPGDLASVCGASNLPDPPALQKPLGLFGDVDLSPSLGPLPVARRLWKALASVPGRCPLRAHLAATLATFEAVAGNQREARAWAEPLESDFPPGGDAIQRARMLRAAIALYTGDVTLARGLIDRLVAEPSEKATLLWIASIRERGDQVMISAPQQKLGVMLTAPHRDDPWALTTEGDGARLATFLQRHDAESPSALLVLGAPQLTRGREELLSWFRWGDRWQSTGARPSKVLIDARSRATALEALGDPELAAQSSEIAEAFYRALGSREIAVPVAVLDEL